MARYASTERTYGCPRCDITCTKREMDIDLIDKPLRIYNQHRFGLQASCPNCHGTILLQDLNVDMWLLVNIGCFGDTEYIDFANCCYLKEFI